MLAAEAISQGRQARQQNNLSLARACYAQAAKVYRDQNDSLSYAHAIRHIADMYLDESNLAEAKPLYEESLEIYRCNLNTKLLDLANAIRPYALLHEKSGNIGAAKDLWQEAGNLYRSLRLEEGIRECNAHLAQLLQSARPSGGVIQQ